MFEGYGDDADNIHFFNGMICHCLSGGGASLARAYAYNNRLLQSAFGDERIVMVQQVRPFLIRARALAPRFFCITFAASAALTGVVGQAQGSDPPGYQYEERFQPAGNGISMPSAIYQVASTEINVKGRGAQNSKISSAPSIDVNSTYSSTCMSAPGCLAITGQTNPMNGQTLFSYSGGLLSSVQSPEVSAGVRPMTRYSYFQRRAWLSDGAGGNVQSSDPAWLRSEERTCQVSATVGNGCANGSSDEVVTTHDYGPNSGPNNLRLRGVAVTANGQTLRTCYGYDDLGRKISETSPNANLTSCP